MVCSLCGDSYKEEIPAAGHKEVIDEAVAPTCEKVERQKEVTVLYVMRS